MNKFLLNGICLHFVVLTLSLLGVSTPQFDLSSIRILEATTPGTYEVKISAGGRFVVGYVQVFRPMPRGETDTVTPAEFVQSELQVWETSTLGQPLADRSDSVFVPPVASILLNNTRNMRYMDQVFSIAPDEYSVAVHDGESVKIFSLPLLELQSTFPTRGFGAVHWSPDGTRLAWTAEGEFTVWNQATHQTFSYSLSSGPERPYDLLAFEHGWVLDDNRTTFVFCAPDGASCEQQVLDSKSGFMTVQPDQNGTTLFIVYGGDPTAITEQWVWNARTGDYQRRATMSDVLDLCPHQNQAYLSPDGTHVFSNCEDVIWQLSPLATAFALDTTIEARFVGAFRWSWAGRMFATLDLVDAEMGLRLYQLERDTPLDGVRLDGTLGENWNRLLTENEITLTQAGVGNIHFSPNDEFVIVDVDWGLVYIGLEYAPYPRVGSDP